MRFAKKHKKMGPRRMQAVMPVPRVRVPRLSGPYKGKKAKPKIAKGSASAVDLPTLQTPDSGSLLVLHHPRNQALPAESKTEVQTKAQLNLLLQLQLSSCSSSCSSSAPAPARLPPPKGAQATTTARSGTSFCQSTLVGDKKHSNSLDF
ncbi:hypothetical protein Cadr_000012509 [Camelus dromedarius]|uniref:60S ribosomal protein L29 n=1 Tax=Camelus dromedarius TaxID=9838 RepID=A0A5N4D8L6_CAMDR|nr:hypothetical protein Cadr_000012509 [Camelus dromedarius]